MDQSASPAPAPSGKAKIIIPLVVLVALPIGVLAYMSAQRRALAPASSELAVAAPTTSAEPTPSTTPVATPEATKETAPAPTPAVKKTVYQDGRYSAIGEYRSPAGPEEIAVVLTLQNDKITEVSVEPKATIPKSVFYQDVFVKNFQPLVLGKNIDEVQLDKVSSSSLTPKGFNDALAKIKADAKNS
jgi:hypothetical protein